MHKTSRIFVAGTHALIGMAVQRELARQGYCNLIGERTQPPDLCDAQEVEKFFRSSTPDYVFFVGGRSGGIQANRRYSADLIRENLLSQCHVIHSASKYGTKKLLFLGSSCSYPQDCDQPMQVASFMKGPLEPSSEAYAMAKLAGMAMVRAYGRQYQLNAITGIPSDVFGAEDDFCIESSHVVPALIRKMHEAKAKGSPSVEVWGSGTPQRQFIFADDIANACVFIMNHYDGPSPINLGGTETCSISEVAKHIKDVVGYCGELRFNTEKPDGMPFKTLDCHRLLKMGWKPATSLHDALSLTYEWYVKNFEVSANREAVISG